MKRHDEGGRDEGGGDRREREVESHGLRRTSTCSESRGREVERALRRRISDVLLPGRHDERRQ
jgi:hypothetical protein